MGKLAVGVGGGDLEAVVFSESPGRAADVEHDGVVHEPVEDCGGDDGVAEDLDRSELGVFLFTAEHYDRDHAALAVLLGLNGLRVSEACATNVEDLGIERGHRTLRIVGKGNKPATVPLVPRTARTIDLAVGERHEGPILRRRDGHRLDRRTAHRWVRSIGNRAGLDAVHPHMLRAAFIMAALDAGVPLRDVQIAARHPDPRTPCATTAPAKNLDRHGD